MSNGSTAFSSANTVEGNTRRQALAALAMAVAAVSVPALAANRPKLRAIAFDAFVLFDPAPLRIACTTMFGEQGCALAGLWSTKLFAYTWLVSVMERYEPFVQLARKSLTAASRSFGLVPTEAQLDDLVDVYRQLHAWPDVANALSRLASANVEIAVLSNLGEAQLNANLARAGLFGHVRHVLSTDRVRRFKPAPAAYAMATEALSLRKTEIGFAAFAEWDAAGARSFGYRTAWVNRSRALAEQLMPAPDVTGTDMSCLTSLG